MSQQLPPIQKIVFKSLHPDAILPKRAHATDAGYDIYSCFTEESVYEANKKNLSYMYEMSGITDGIPHVLITSYGTVSIPCGIAVQLPDPVNIKLGRNSDGVDVYCPAVWQMEVTPRSGLALNKHITVLNTPGTVDSGYTGEICVLLYNTSQFPVMIYSGERIAQIKYSLSLVPDQEFVAELQTTDRGSKGFGDTGNN